MTRRGKTWRRCPACPSEQSTGPRRGPATQTRGLPQHHRFAEAKVGCRGRLSLPLASGPWEARRGTRCSAWWGLQSGSSRPCSPESSWPTWDTPGHYRRAPWARARVGWPPARGRRGRRLPGSFSWACPASSVGGNCNSCSDPAGSRSWSGSLTLPNND